MVQTLTRPPERTLIRPPAFTGAQLLRPSKEVLRRPEAPEGTAKALLPEEVYASAEYRPIVTMFMGRRGDGKSLSMRAMAEIMERRYLIRRNPFKIASNFWMSNADYWGQGIVEDIQEFPQWARNLFLCIDEATAYFPSTRAMSRINLDFGTFLKQIRKRSIEVSFTTQFPQELTRDILRQVDLFVRCEKWWDGVPGTPNARLHADWYIFDFWGQWTGRDHYKSFPPPKYEYDWLVTIKNLHTLFGKYRTEEVIAPVWANAEKRQEMAFAEVGDLMQVPEAPATITVAPAIQGGSPLETFLRDRTIVKIRTLRPKAAELEPTILTDADFKDWLVAHDWNVKGFDATRKEPS